MPPRNCWSILFGSGLLSQFVPEVIISIIGALFGIWLWFGVGVTIGLTEGFIWLLGPYGELTVLLIVFGGLYLSVRIAIWLSHQFGPYVSPPSPIHPVRVGLFVAIWVITLLTYKSVENPTYGDILGLSLDQGVVIIIEGVLAGWLEWYRVRSKDGSGRAGRSLLDVIYLWFRNGVE